MQTIQIEYGKEHRVKITTDIQKDTFFREVYFRAGRIVNEIIEETDALQREKYRGVGKDRVETLNNIILFNGSRGQGKTSAMRSFNEILRQHKLEDVFDEYNFVHLNHIAFHSLRVIEPSMFNEKESIVRVFLSELFWYFKSSMEDNQNDWKDYSVKDRNELLRKFTQCFENINYIENPDYKISEQDDLDELLRLGRSVELRNELYGLIEDVKKYCYSGNDGIKHYFIVMIDDTDLSVKNAYEICEGVREYLTVPGLIILMAADFDQLKYAVLQKYLVSYQSLNSFKTEYGIADICKEMEWRYLEKLFPIDHRVQLPSLAKIDLSKIKLQYVSFGENLEKNLLEKHKECDSLEKVLSKIIFDKTGMVFLPGKICMKYILPTSMRELSHFLKVLYSMDEVNYKKIYQNYWGDNDQELNLLERNIELFKHYFIYNWCNARIPVAYREYIISIFEEDLDIDAINRIIKKCLKKQGSSEELEKGKPDEFWNNICHFQNRDAVLILLTIMLNETFVKCMREKRYTKIKDVVKILGEKINQIQKEIIIEISGDSKEETITKKLLEVSLKKDQRDVIKQRANGELFLNVFFEENDDRGVNFDIWKPLIILIDAAENPDRISELYSVDKTESLLGKEQLTNVGDFKKDKGQNKILFLRNIQWIITNIDVQLKILENISLIPQKNVPVKDVLNCILERYNTIDVINGKDLGGSYFDASEYRFDFEFEENFGIKSSDFRDNIEYILHFDPDVANRDLDRVESKLDEAEKIIDSAAEIIETIKSNGKSINEYKSKMEELDHVKDLFIELKLDLYPDIDGILNRLVYLENKKNSLENRFTQIMSCITLS